MVFNAPLPRSARHTARPAATATPPVHRWLRRLSAVLLPMLPLLACGLAAPRALAAPVAIGYTGVLQTFTVQTSGIYTVTAAGAQGGRGYFNFVGGLGAQVFGGFHFDAGTVLNIVVGGAANFAGGGGGSFIYTVLNELLLAAGGGGGGSYDTNGGDSVAGTSGSAGMRATDQAGAGGQNGSGGQSGANYDGLGSNSGGGGGWVSNGTDGRASGGGHGLPDFAGGIYQFGSTSIVGQGGFDGGGGGLFAGGGGGGYSGGGSGVDDLGGGGGGSYIAAGALNSGGMSGSQHGNGLVVFDLLTADAAAADVPEPASLALAGTPLAALALARRCQPR